MSETLEWFADLDWVAIGEIIVIDILLGGDNALLIAQGMPRADLVITMVSS